MNRRFFIAALASGMAALAGATRLAKSTPLWQEPVLAGLRVDFLDRHGNIVACAEAHASNPASNGEVVVECGEATVERSATVTSAELVTSEGRFPLPPPVLNYPACLVGESIYMQPLVITAA
jgi:hypothetical protein